MSLPPVKQTHLYKEQRDTCRNTLFEIAAMVGFAKGEKPNKDQLLQRIAQRLKPYNDLHNSPPPQAVTSAVATSPASKPMAPPPRPPAPKPAPYKPSNPSYSGTLPPRVGATASWRKPPPPKAPEVGSSAAALKAAEQAKAARALEKRRREERNAPVDFEYGYTRFHNLIDSAKFGNVTKVFPSHIKLTAGSRFTGDGGRPYRIIGHNPKAPAFSVVCCTSTLLEDPAYVFGLADIVCYRTECVVRKCAGSSAENDLRAERVKTNAARYGLWPAASSKEGFTLEVHGVHRSVRVVDINPRQHDRPIIIEEVPAMPHLNTIGQRWNISANRLNEARPDTISFAKVGPVPLHRDARPAPAPAPVAPEVPPSTTDPKLPSGLASALTSYLASQPVEAKPDENEADAPDANALVGDPFADSDDEDDEPLSKKVKRM